MIRYHMNWWSEADAWMSRSEDLQRLFSEAIALVLRDAGTILGKVLLPTLSIPMRKH